MRANLIMALAGLGLGVGLAKPRRPEDGTTVTAAGGRCTSTIMSIIRLAIGISNTCTRLMGVAGRSICSAVLALGGPVLVSWGFPAT
jgi:hypothetical protein